MATGPYPADFLNTRFKDVPQYLTSNMGSHFKNLRQWYVKYYFVGGRPAPIVHGFLFCSAVHYYLQSSIRYQMVGPDGEDIFHHSRTKYDGAHHGDHDWS